ncbi:MAG: hypothetical protein KAR25_00970 [Methanosarcinales archaeon]|nr:hypothetical protein [Methanosarcinales archaeon]
MPRCGWIAATIRRVAGCELGPRQQIIFIDPGNRPSDWKLIVQIVGG